DTVVDYDDAAIEQFAHVDGQAGEGAAAAELHQARPEADGVVAGHDAAVTAAEDQSEIRRRPPPDGLGLRGRLTEAPIEVDDDLRRSPLRRLDGANIAQPQLTDEPILQRGPQALDAPFGLRRARADVADGESLQDAAEMRGQLHAGELFVDRPVGVVADEQIQAIAVDG